MSVDLLGALVRKPGRESFGLDLSLEVLPISAQLSIETATEISKASAGSTLAKVADASVPALMDEGAANTAGAYYKSAFWLARAARIFGAQADKHEQDPTAVALEAGARLRVKKALEKANEYFAKASSLSALTYSPVNLILPISRNKSDILEVFREAAPAAAGTEIYDKLLRLGSFASTETRQALVEKQTGLKPDASASDRVYAMADKVLPLSWLGDMADKVTYQAFEATRPYTDKELADAKKAIREYDLTAAEVLQLESIKAMGVGFSEEQSSRLADLRSYLATVSQPVAKAKEYLKIPAGPTPPISPQAMSGAFGADEDDDIFGIEPATTTVVIVVAVAAAIIFLGLYYAWSQQKSRESQELYLEKTKELQACIANPNTSFTQRALCQRALAQLKPPREAGPQDLLWAGAALAVVVGGLWAFGPMLKEVGGLGADRLQTYRTKQG